MVTHGFDGGVRGNGAAGVWAHGVEVVFGASHEDESCLGVLGVQQGECFHEFVDAFIAHHATNEYEGEPVGLA